MALGAFEELRARRSRGAVLGAALLWLAAIATCPIAGIALGLGLLLLIDLPLDALGLDGGWAFGVGWSFAALTALVGFPAAIALADRLGAWVTGDRPTDPTDPADRRIEAMVRTVALAAGVDPLVLVVPEPWVDGAALGRRRGREVVVVSRGAARLDDEHLELLAGSVLADSIVGRGAARARAATSAPGAAASTLARATGRAMRRNPRAVGWLGLAWLAGLTLTLVVGSEDGVTAAGLVLAPLGIALLTVLCGVVLAICVGIYVVWSALLGLLARPIAARARKVADLGMAGLVRAPEQWVSFLAEMGARDQRPPAGTYLTVGWVLPRDGRAARRRIAHLVEQVPGARAALGHLPLRETTT